MNVLLPVDFSDNSRRAIDYAVAAFGSTETYFYLFHVYSLPHGTSKTIFVSIKDELKEDAEKSMTKELAYVKEKYPRMHFSGLTVYGHFIDDCNSFIDREGIDVAVMGTKGASGLEEILIGSNASEAVQNLTVPVMTVPSECALTSPDKAVLAIDYLDLEENTINQLNGLMQQFGVQNLYVVHIKDPEDETELNREHAETQLKNSLQGVDFSFHIKENKDVEEGIKEFREEVGGELVVVINPVKGLWGRLFKTAHSKKLAMHTNIPLLVLHEK